ncbi:hypothetical protein DHW03_15115 [Pedobacter yonginense]|uniref:Uncharacterized protein n=1 Tax=Pedobacter yonginense TaxID=651869 RepID=A0A317EIF0_9SPHI|nr:hypothetical protein [Pedobacter yonginense]PWS26125.1 hypothetical protein DHW03_15115 [Pedobacter yonginense]
MKAINQILNLISILIFSIAISGIGFVHLLSDHFPIGLLPVSKSIFTGIVCYTVGVTMIMASVLLNFQKTSRIASILLSILLLILTLAISIPDLIGHFYNANNWTGTFEMISLFSISLIISGFILKNTTVLRWGNYLLASGLIVFAVLHYRYAKFIIFLMPGWVPEKELLNGMIMAVFLCSAFSLISSKLSKITMPVLGSMFLIWVLILHLPRVMEKPLIEAEWTSLFIALAMGSVAFFRFLPLVQTENP